MGGEYCMCPGIPCPICHTQANQNLCSCGCGPVGSAEFMKAHVDPECTCPEQPCPKCVIPELEQRAAEEEASRQFHEEEIQATHPFGCNCPECN